VAQSPDRRARGAKDLAIWIKEHLKPTERAAAYDKIKTQIIAKQKDN
jgi:hypothetical protein